MTDVLRSRMSRRVLLAGGVGLAAAALVPAMSPLAQARDGLNIIYGPERGSLPHGNDADGMTRIERADVRLRDGVIAARFFNPYDSRDSQWDYGFFFRENNTAEYLLVIASLGDYRLVVRGTNMPNARKIVNSGPIPDLRLGADEANEVLLAIDGDRGLLNVNGNDVAQLDLSDHGEYGDVLIATGFTPEHERQGAETRYEDFFVALPA